MFEEYWEIGVKKDFFKEQQIENEVASSIFKQDPQGRDEWSQQTQEGKMWVKYELLEENNPQDIFYTLAERYLRMNKESIYVAASFETGYRGVQSQIPFEDIISVHDYT